MSKGHGPKTCSLYLGYILGLTISLVFSLVGWEGQGGPSFPGGRKTSGSIFGLGSVTCHLLRATKGRGSHDSFPGF